MTPSENITIKSGLFDRIGRIWDWIVQFVFPAYRPKTDEPPATAFARTPPADETDNEPASQTPNTGDEPTEEEIHNGFHHPFGEGFTYKAFTDWLVRMSDMEHSPFFHLGYKNGRLGGRVSDAIKYIEATFNAWITTASQTRRQFETSIQNARSQWEALKVKVDELDHDLDERNETGKIRKIRIEIEAIREQIRQHRQAQHEDKFVQDYAKIIEERKNTELEYIESMKVKQAALHDELQDIIKVAAESIKEKVQQEARQKNEPNSKGSGGSFLEWLKSILPEAERAIENLTKLYTKSFQSAEALHLRVIKQYKKLMTFVLRDSISVPSALRLFLTGLFFVFTLVGEIYVIFHMTTKALGIDPKNDAVQAGAPEWLLWVFCLILCIAFPLAVGMLTKSYISSHDNRSVATRRVGRILAVTTILMIIGLAMLNPMALDGMAQGLQVQADSWIKNLLHPIYISIFTGITFLFSGIAGILYVDFIEGFEAFLNARKRPPFSIKYFIPGRHPRPDEFVAAKEAEIHEQESVIEKMKQEREDYLRQLYNLEELANTDISQWNLDGTLEETKIAAINACKHGYQSGLHELFREKNYDPAELIDLLNSRRIMKYYLKFFDE